MKLAHPIPWRGLARRVQSARRIAQTAALALFAVTCMADPAPPVGWKHALGVPASDGAAHSIYRPTDRNDVELRLFAAQADAQPLNAWFTQRLRSPVQGFGVVSFGTISTAGKGVLIATGSARAGALQQMVVAIACQGPSGKKRFAQLLLPADTRQVRHFVAASAVVMEPACLERADAAVAAVVQPKPEPSATSAVPAQPRPVPVANALKPADIEGVLYAWQQRYEFNGLRFREWTHLLLKDGRVRKGAPKTAPADFDVVADQKATPEDWGRWKRVGKKVLVDYGEGFVEPPGQLMRWPGKRGERLNGVYETSDSYSTGSGAGSVTTWATWGLELKPDGTFKHWTSGGFGGTAGSGSSAVVTMGTRDDKGSTVSVGGPSFAGGSSSTAPLTDADLEGNYEIDGWTMTLRYRSGKVQRTFFYTDDDRKNVWFHGGELTKR